jgi:plasmid stabilization system protein ParE
LTKPTRLELTRAAMFDLRDAAEHLRLAGAVNALAAVRRAMKSTAGAVRHAERLEGNGPPVTRRITKACPRRNLPRPPAETFRVHGPSLRLRPEPA